MMLIIARRLAVVLALTASIPHAAAAQQLDMRAAGVRVRAHMCEHAPQAVRSSDHIGALVGSDSASLVIENANGIERIRLADVRSLEVMTRPGRDARGAGIIGGLLLGPFIGTAVLIGLDPHVAMRDEGAVNYIPVGTLVGAVAGYVIGWWFMRPAEWTSLQVTTGHDTSCVFDAGTP